MFLARVDEGVYRLQPPRRRIPGESEVVCARGADEEVGGAGGGGPDGREHCDARMEGAGMGEVEAGRCGSPYFEAVGFARGEGSER